jgi:hypothetical protein
MTTPTYTIIDFEDLLFYISDSMRYEYYLPETEGEVIIYSEVMDYNYNSEMIIVLTFEIDYDLFCHNFQSKYLQKVKDDYSIDFLLDILLEFKRKIKINRKRYKLLK